MSRGAALLFTGLKGGLKRSSNVSLADMNIQDMLTNIRLFNSANGVALIPLKENVVNDEVIPIRQIWDDLNDDTLHPSKFTEEVLENHKSLDLRQLFITVDNKTFNKLITHPYVTDCYRFYAQRGELKIPKWVEGLKFNYQLTGRMCEFYGCKYLEVDAGDYRYDVYTYKVLPPKSLEDQLNLEIESLKAYTTNLRRVVR
jgi:hypothetical protein